MCHQVAVLFLAIIGGSLFNEIEKITGDGDATEVVESIASAMPGQSQFFMGLLFVATATLTGELARVVPIVIALIMGAVSVQHHMQVYMPKVSWQSVVIIST
jgi:Calcium-dependent channel, 7TM region, putative phosphate